MSLKELIKQLDDQLVIKTDEYIKLHERFDTFRGKVLDEDMLKEVNELVMQIQDKFQELYIVYHFIGHRYEAAKNTAEGYHTFINDLKKSGAVEIEGEA